MTFQIKPNKKESENKTIRFPISLIEQIDDAIKAIGQEGNYVYIFDLSTTQIPFVNETLSTDITSAVKAKLGIQ